MLNNYIIHTQNCDEYCLQVVVMSMLHVMSVVAHQDGLKDEGV